MNEFNGIGFNRTVHHMHTSPEKSRDLSSREVYEQVLRIVEYNTGPPGPQPASIARHTIAQHGRHSGIDSEDVDRALRAARQRQFGRDLVHYTVDGTDRYCLRDAESVWAAMEFESERGNAEIVAMLYAVYHDLGGDDGDQ